MNEGEDVTVLDLCYTIKRATTMCLAKKKKKKKKKEEEEEEEKKKDNQFCEVWMLPIGNQFC